MMDSSPHLVGLTVPCHVCREPLVVPDKSSGESGSFVLAHAQGVARAKAATLLLSAEAEEPRTEGMEDALTDFQSAISLDPKCSLAIHNRAVTLAQQNQFAAALRDFNRVIELNPGLAVAYRNRAELLAALGRMNEALSDYNQALESLPRWARR